MKLTLSPTEVKTIEAEVRSLRMEVDTTNQVGEAPYVVYPNLYRAGEDYDEDGTWTVRLPGADGSELELRFADRKYLEALTRTLMGRLGISEDRSTIKHQCEVQGTKIKERDRKVLLLGVLMLQGMVREWLDNKANPDELKKIATALSESGAVFMAHHDTNPFDLGRADDRVNRFRGGGEHDPITSEWDVEDAYRALLYADEVRCLYHTTNTVDRENPC